MTTPYERRRNLGLAGGSLWLVAIGTAFAAWALLLVRSALAACLLAAISVAAVVLLVSGVALVRAVLQLPCFATGPSQGRRIMVRFAAIVAAEGVACAIVSAACAHAHHWKWIVPLNLVIVGLHFLPLARLFKVPRYNLTGALFCILPLATMLLTPSSAHVGHALTWLTIPPVGCALVCLATAWAGLNEVRRFVSGRRSDINLNGRPPSEALGGNTEPLNADTEPLRAGIEPLAAPATSANPNFACRAN